jgi:hypothetical protein
MSERKLKGPLGFWDFPIFNGIKGGFRRQEEDDMDDMDMMTQQQFDSDVEQIIRRQQEQWRSMGWSEGLIRAASEQARGYARGIARLAGQGNTALEEQIYRNLFTTGEALRIANEFGTRLRQAFTRGV